MPRRCWQRWVLTSLLVAGCQHSRPADLPLLAEADRHAREPLRPVAASLKASVQEPATSSQSYPIDLLTALQLAEGQNPDIALARERIREALAAQEGAEVLWYPSLELGSTWIRHDGQIQRANGEVFTTGRSSLFVGGGPALNLRLGEALFAPLAARQLTVARHAGAAAVNNDRLLEVALTYLDLLQVHAELQINAEALANARELYQINLDLERSGKVALADTAQSRVEVLVRERDRHELTGRLATATARLARLLQLPPDISLQPLDPLLKPQMLVPDGIPLPELLAQGLSHRPELAESRALIQAAVERWRAARAATCVPDLRLGVSSGGFGGGINEFFGDFNGRVDVTTGLVWQLRNFGLGDLALIRERQSQVTQASLRQQALTAEIAAQIVTAYQQAQARRQALELAAEAVLTASQAHMLNEQLIQRAPEQRRPNEVLRSLQTLARVRLDYLAIVAEFNRSQFRLYTALGNPPRSALETAVTLPTAVPTVPDADEQTTKAKGTAP